MRDPSLVGPSLSVRHGRLPSLEAQFFTAIDKLCGTDVWLDMLAENVLYRGGIERFFQRSLLWAFNTVDGSDYWTDIEQSVTPLSGSEQLDFLFYRRNSENIAEVWASDKLPAHRWLEIGDAFCEMKCFYNLATIEFDIRKFRRIAEELAPNRRGRVPFYEMVLYWNYFYQRAEEECLRTLSSQDAKCLALLKDLGIDRTCCVGESWLLRGRPNPSDRSMTTYFKVLILAVPTEA